MGQMIQPPVFMYSQMPNRRELSLTKGVGKAFDIVLAGGLKILICILGSRYAIRYSAGYSIRYSVLDYLMECLIV